jgi:hypothetical protein
VTRPDLVLVACGARKRPRAAIAADLYTGPYYRACAAYAHWLVGMAGWRRVYVLSAKHGLLPLDQWTHPYELRLGQEGAITAEQVRQQAEERGLLARERVVILGGRRYAALAREVWPEAISPLEGVGGIGKQMKQLRLWAAERSGK